MEIFDQENPQNQPAEPESGYYHGAGVGQRETVYTTEQPSFESPQPTEPEAPQPQRRNRKKTGIGKKIFRGMGLTVLAILLVVTSCGLTAALSGWYWNSLWTRQYNTMQQNLMEKADALQSQLDELEKRPGGSAGALEPSGDSLTAAQIYEENVRSVVAIQCQVRTTSNGQSFTATSAGTGFVLSEDGYIITNHHVIEGATAVTVVFFDGNEISARIIGSDSTNDVALLKVNVTGLDPVTLGSSHLLQVGDQVVAIGNALGEFSASLTVGFVSGMDRKVTTDGTTIQMIQTDAAINSGNSGGPLFNAKGQVIGITTAKYSGTSSSGASIEGIGFAIPIDDVLGILEDLRQFGYVKSAYLGILASDVDANTADYYGFPVGVYVAGAEPGFCAYEAGLQPKDIITELGGYKITCLSDLSRALRQLSPGETVTMQIWRGGQVLLLEVTLDEKPQS